MTLSCVACTLRTDAAQTAQFHHLEPFPHQLSVPESAYTLAPEG